jgi:hypothetical protein
VTGLADKNLNYKIGHVERKNTGKVKPESNFIIIVADRTLIQPGQGLRMDLNLLRGSEGLTHQHFSRVNVSFNSIL